MLKWEHSDEMHKEKKVKIQAKDFPGEVNADLHPDFLETTWQSSNTNFLVFFPCICESWIPTSSAQKTDSNHNRLQPW